MRRRIPPDHAIIAERRTRRISLHDLRSRSGGLRWLQYGRLPPHRGAKQDFRVNADQLSIGTTATSPRQDAAPSLRIRALMLGDRINTSGLEIGTLVSSAPVAFRVHAGLAVIF